MNVMDLLVKESNLYFVGAAMSVPHRIEICCSREVS